VELKVIDCHVITLELGAKMIAEEMGGSELPANAEVG
jgi:hypothetical protein